MQSVLDTRLMLARSSLVITIFHHQPALKVSTSPNQEVALNSPRGVLETAETSGDSRDQRDLNSLEEEAQQAAVVHPLGLDALDAHEPAIAPL